MAKTNDKPIKVLNKFGKYVSHIDENVAHMSVKQDKSEWVDSSTIRVLYHQKDERRFKHEAWERDNYRCYLCDKQMHKDHPELTVDHVYPKRLGGSILIHNIKTCCRPCNEQKAHRTYKQYFWNLYAGLLFMVLWWSNKERRKNDCPSKNV